MNETRSARSSRMNKRERFPLSWPVGWKRTEMNDRIPMKTWRTPFGKVRSGLFLELDRLGVADAIVSTNLTLNLSGLPYDPGGLIADPGVAVYFDYKKRGMCIACDRYRDVTHNLNAIRMTIEAIRGMERWGASQMMERAFFGFAELPETISDRRPWREILRFTGPQQPANADAIEQRYRELARTTHPDVGGSQDAMSALNVARDEALRELAGK